MSHLQELADKLAGAAKDLVIRANDGDVETSRFIFSLRVDLTLPKAGEKLYMNYSQAAIEMFAQYVTCAQLPTSAAANSNLIELYELAQKYNFTSLTAHLKQVLTGRASDNAHCCEIIYLTIPNISTSKSSSDTASIHETAVKTAATNLTNNIKCQVNTTCQHGSDFMDCNSTATCGHPCRSHVDSEACSQKYCGAYILTHKLDLNTVTCQHGRSITSCGSGMSACGNPCRSHVNGTCPSNTTACSWHTLKSRMQANVAKPAPLNLNKYPGVADIIIQALIK